MNINMLRDSDNDPGIYAAVCASDPFSTSWTGASIFVSNDGGSTYTLSFNATAETVMGVTRDVLPNFLGGNIVDELSRVTVDMTNGTLSSVTLDAILSNTNACIIGDEILCFREATLNTDGSYTLSGLLRGRRGSEYAMGIHAIGDRFVLADLTRMVRVTQSTSDIGLTKKYMAVTSGMAQSTGIPRDFTNLGTGLMPYAPVQIGGGFALGDAILTWIRRNRISGEWRGSVDVPNSEATESYEIDVYDGSGYATVKRTLTASSPTVTYSAADQTADFGSSQSHIYFRVYQMSAIVGRGHAGTGSI